MELSLVIEALIWAVPILIALISLVYTIKQRNVVKKEISKKRYLENALTNLNEALEVLRKVRTLDITKSDDYEEWVDTATDFQCLTSEVLRASFDQKNKKILMNVSYKAEVWKFENKGKTSDIETTNVSLNDLQGFLEMLRSSSNVSIDSETDIASHIRTVSNDPGFTHIIANLHYLKRALQKLLSFEEVYESIYLDCVRNVEKVFEETATEVFSSVNHQKSIEIDLGKFHTAREISEYLCKEILNYPSIADKLSKITELVSELTETRRQLFLKIA